MMSKAEPAGRSDRLGGTWKVCLRDQQGTHSCASAIQYWCQSTRTGLLWAGRGLGVEPRAAWAWLLALALSGADLELVTRFPELQPPRLFRLPRLWLHSSQDGYEGESA